MCYCPTPTLHLNLALTGDCAFLFPLKKTHSVWFISVLNYGDTENVLINHLLLVIPMSYPCHYTNLCPHKPHKHAHPHTHRVRLDGTQTSVIHVQILEFICPHCVCVCVWTTESLKAKPVELLGFGTPASALWILCSFLWRKYACCSSHFSPLTPLTLPLLIGWRSLDQLQIGYWDMTLLDGSDPK